MPDLFAIASSVGLVMLLAVLLKNLTGSMLTPVVDEAADALSRELATFLQHVDLTRPVVKDVSILVVTLPDYATLCRTTSLDSIYQLMNHYYQVVSDLADREKGEISSLAGSEMFVVFGRILAVDQPLSVAMETAWQIVERLRGPVQGVGEAGERCRGAAVSVVFGPVMSGPLGGEWRRTYTTVGPVVDTAFTLARRASPGQLLVPAGLSERLPPHFQHEAVPGPGAPDGVLAGPATGVQPEPAEPCVRVIGRLEPVVAPTDPAPPGGCG